MDSELFDKILTGGLTKRDKQADIGPSEIGGCSARAWHRLNETPALTGTIRLPARMGTAIHKMIEDEFDNIDPFSTRYKREIEVTANGLRGHVDCYDTQEHEVIDWKTTLKKNLSKFPSHQQRTQVQLYGYLLEANGYKVETVTLVAIPRDGTELEIKVHSEPYDQRMAVWGFNWLADIREMAAPPDPQMPAKTFCSRYCQFYDSTGEVGCTGK